MRGEAEDLDVQLDDGQRMEVVKWPDWNRADIETVRLAANLFPDLSADVVSDLSPQDCMVPQPWLAAEPANVVYGRFLEPGQIDAAVLCSIGRVSSILLYRGNSTDHAAELVATMADSVYLQDVGRGRMGFSRQIGVADSEPVRDKLTSLGRLETPRTVVDANRTSSSKKARSSGTRTTGSGATRIGLSFTVQGVKGGGFEGYWFVHGLLSAKIRGVLREIRRLRRWRCENTFLSRTAMTGVS